MRLPFFLVVGLIFGLIILGLATLHSSLIMLAIPLMSYVFVAVLQRPEAINLTVTREVSPDYAPQGEPITVKLTVSNQGAATDELVIWEVLPSGTSQTAGKAGSISTLPLQGKVELEYTIEAQRGEYNQFETLVAVRDFSGLFELTSSYRSSPQLVVHPRYPKLNRIKIRPPQTRGFAGPISARQGGTGTDFWSVREYQAGDPQRQINWKLTARSERELYTTIFEQERVADVGIILDARQRTNVVTESGNLFEHSIRAAAALAENFLDDGNRVSLLIYGSGLTRVFPGYGKVQQDRILRRLAKASTEVNYALESLHRLPTRMFPAKSQLVLVSSLIPEDSAVIARMRALGYAVLVISPNPLTFEAGQDSNSLALRLASAERMLMLRQVQQTGVRLIDWQVNQPLEGTIRTALARQPLVTQQYRNGL